jgi:hypothetical protein
LLDLEKYEPDLIEESWRNREVADELLREFNKSWSTVTSTSSSVRPPYGKTVQHRSDAVESSLEIRREDDYYGLLRKTGSSRAQCSFIEPSPEALAVISGLSASGPEVGCAVGDVRLELHRLGIRVGSVELVEALEGAGLSMRVADASDAVRVDPPFNRYSNED